MSLLVFHIGIEEGEKCSSKVVFAGASCGQQTKIILEVLRQEQVSQIYIISSLTPVSQTCLKVMEFTFVENGINIIGSIDILGTEDDDGIPVAQAVEGSDNGYDEFYIINIAEGKYYPAIVYGLHNQDIADIRVINTFINEYDIKAADQSLLADFPDQYFVTVFHDTMTGSLIKDIRNVVKSRIGRENDLFITSNFFIIHSLFQLYVKAVTYSQSTDSKHYQKYIYIYILFSYLWYIRFIYNHPIINENEMYLISSSNYADTQLSIVHIDVLQSYIYIFYLFSLLMKNLM